MSGKKKKRSAGGFFRTLLLLIALGIFCFSGYQLFGILRVYYASGREYSGLAKQFTSANAAETQSGEKQVTDTASQVHAAALRTYESIPVRLFAQTDALKGVLKNSGTAASDTQTAGENGQTEGGNTAGTPGSDQSGTVQAGSAQPGTAQDGNAQQSGIVTGESEQPGAADTANAAAAGSTRLNTFRAPQQPDLDDAKAPLDVNWAELKQVNPDIVGWLYLEGEPSISYPICLAEDNDYYLHRTFERKDLFAGAIFEDYHNAGDFSDPNSIVYGHNMKNGSMFGKLKYLTDSYDEHPYFWILTPYANYRYRIYSIMTTSVTSDVYMLYSVHDERYLTWEEALRSQSEVKSDVRLFREDKTVTLSTCTSDSDYRKVVIGKCVSLQRPVKREIIDPRAALYAESSLPDEEDYVDDDEDLDY